MNFDLAFHTTDEVGTIGTGRNDARHWFAVFGDDNAVWIEIFQQCKALLLKFGRVDGLHDLIIK